MLTTTDLRYAYAQGIFPMAMDDGEIGWFQPRRRCLFSIGGIHVSRSLQKRLRETLVVDPLSTHQPDKPVRFTVRFDEDYEHVMRGCLRPDDNWISEEIIQAYTAAWQEGWGHCASVFEGDELVGGTYGLAVGRCFCAESMFHRVTDASKIALWAMVEWCRLRGFELFDAQIMNPHLASLGAFEISQRKYMLLLERASGSPSPQ